jgi:Na+/H+ antiporter NhaD/arsenite permease-like protein
MKKKALLLPICALALGIGGFIGGLTRQQSFIVAVFSVSILGTLFFWDFRLGFLFIGSGILFLIHAVDIEHFIKYASLDVILFLMGMMIVVGMMKESGIFHELAAYVLKIKDLNGLKLFIIITVFSAVLSGLTGEVTSIIIMVAVILDISDLLKINPLPLVISSVLTTNIGSASTLLGNPIGVLIALRGGLTFEDFLTHALPLSSVILATTIAILCIWYRDYIAELSVKLAAEGKAKFGSHSVSFDAKQKINTLIFAILIVLIAFHNRLEMLFGIAENHLLIILPVIFAGIVMLYHHDKAIYYIERDVEWKSLLFFTFLFAQAGVIQSSGVAQSLAARIVESIGTQARLLSGATLFLSGILSGILDNTVVVASFIPIVKNLHTTSLSLAPLWWALLFGACLGGNITAIGSTANIIALGLLEKQRNMTVNFLNWLKLGLIIGIVSMLIAYIAIAFVPIFSK